MQFLVIARVVERISIEQVLPHVQAEAEAVWQKYLDQILRSIYYIADMSGAVLMCEASNLEVIQEMTTQFPMAKAGILKFEILPLMPYTGLVPLRSSSKVTHSKVKSVRNQGFWLFEMVNQRE